MAHNDSFLTRVARAARGFLIPNSPDNSLEDQIFKEHKLRVDKYEANWREYRGESIASMQNEDGTPHYPINMMKKNIDKINYFAFGRGFDLINDDYATQMKWAVSVWGSNMTEKLIRVGQSGAVCGDSYIMVAPTAIANSILKYDAKNNELITEINAKVSIVILAAKFCTPMYDDFDPDRLIGMMIDIPQRKFDQHGKWTTTYQHMTITDEVVFTESRDMHGEPLRGTKVEKENTIGHIYVHHIRNYPDGESLHGADDITDIAALNRALSKQINGVGKIISYHGDPITLIFGARATNLQKGENKIWGGLPKDGRVENLTLDTDLAAANSHTEKLTETLYATMGVPEIAQGTKQAISNTSGVALHTMYMPLLERADTKHLIYGPHFVEIAITTLRWLQALKLEIAGIDKDKRSKSLSEDDYAKIRLNTVVKFPSVLPKDRLIEAQIQNVLLNSELQDREGALIELGVSEPREKIKAIDKEVGEKAKRKLAESIAMMEVKQRSSDNADDQNDKKIESGSSEGNGVNTSDSDQQKGRKKGSNSSS